MKQNHAPQPPGAHRTFFTPWPPSTTFEQPGDGHQRIEREKLTNDCMRNRSYLANDAAGTSSPNVSRGSSVVHLCSGHVV